MLQVDGIIRAIIRKNSVRSIFFMQIWFVFIIYEYDIIRSLIPPFVSFFFLSLSFSLLSHNTRRHTATRLNAV